MGDYVRKGVYFNTHHTGNANLGASPFCKVAIFVKGERSSRACPSGTNHISSETDCKLAASTLGITFVGVARHYYLPKGCSDYVRKGVYFNTHQIGNANLGASPLCKVAPGHNKIRVGHCSAGWIPGKD